MATNVHLTPELERFARDCVTEGRYNNVSEVVRSYPSAGGRLFGIGGMIEGWGFDFGW